MESSYCSLSSSLKVVVQNTDPMAETYLIPYHLVIRQYSVSAQSPSQIPNPQPNSKPRTAGADLGPKYPINSPTGGDQPICRVSFRVTDLR